MFDIHTILTISIEQYNANNIYFYNTVRNSILENSEFMKMFYSNHVLCMTGLFIEIPCSKFDVQYVHQTNTKCITHIVLHDDIVRVLQQIEQDVMSKSNIQNRSYAYKMDSFHRNPVKIHHPKSVPISHSILVKISGVWKTTDCCGVTYKFGAMTPTNHHK